MYSAHLADTDYGAVASWVKRPDESSVTKRGDNGAARLRAKPRAGLGKFTQFPYLSHCGTGELAMQRDAGTIRSLLRSLQRRSNSLWLSVLCTALVACTAS